MGSNLFDMQVCMDASMLGPTCAAPHVPVSRVHLTPCLGNPHPQALDLCMLITSTAPIFFPRLFANFSSFMSNYNFSRLFIEFVFESVPQTILQVGFHASGMRACFQPRPVHDRPQPCIFSPPLSSHHHLTA